MSSEYYTPFFEERKIKDSWITWGVDNLFPDRLLQLMNKSSKHNAILKTKAAMIGGNGFKKDGLSLTTLQFLKNVYNKYDLDEILARVSYDLEIYGSFCLNIVWSKDRKSIAQINYMDPRKVRIATYREEFQVDHYWVSDDWSSIRKNTPVLYPGFSIKDRSKASQILYVKEYRPGCEWYGIPEYISAANWIELEWEIAMFHLSSIRQGFHPSMVINFANAVPSEEEMDSVIRRLRDEYEGASRGGKVIFTFSDSKDTAPVITPIDLNNSDERFIELNKNVTEGIFVGHRATNPNLFGVRVSGELGNKNDLIESLQVFQAQYVDSKQQLLEQTFNRLSKINGITEKLEINKFKLEMTWQPVVQDMLNILQSPLADEQKINMLILVGYSEDEATKLVKNK
ncbi:MAG: phage portal protein [Planctomycetaceae bacterium]